ncbi:MAG: leucine-rich repeat domain-containing protein [Clostridia bacterium]|nr:leucine-rich repeat domain-containing protein [Clostridia bacterium]
MSGIGTYKETDAVIIPETSPDGDTVTGIGYAAFRTIGDTLTTISLPSTITSLNDNALNGCGNLTYNTYQGVNYLGNEQNPYMILITPSNRDQETYTIHADTKFLYTNAFANCESLTNITIPNKVVSIGAGAFARCTELEEIILPEGVKTLGADAFYHCDSLKKLSVPDSVVSIGDDTFAWLSSIEETEQNHMYYIGNEQNPYLVLMWADNEVEKNCVINSSTKFIKDGAFTGCSLTSVVLLEGLVYIGDYAFSDCTRLTDVYYAGTEAEWNAITIQMDNYPLKDATIHYSYGK